MFYSNPKQHCRDLTEHGNPGAEIFEPLIVIQVNTEFYKGRGMNTFDVTLKCKNGEIKAHRNFLASASPYLIECCTEISKNESKI